MKNWNAGDVIYFSCHTRGEFGKHYGSSVVDRVTNKFVVFTVHGRLGSQSVRVPLATGKVFSRGMFDYDITDQESLRDRFQESPSDRFVCPASVPLHHCAIAQ